MLPPDPGSRRRLLWLWPLCIALFLTVIWQQQSGSALTQQHGVAPSVQVPAAQGDTPQEEMLAAITRATVKMGAAMRQSDPSAPVGSLVHALGQQAQTPKDRLRIAIAAGELQDGELAQRRLNDVVLKSGSPEEGDAAALRAIYQGGKAGLSEEQRSGLVARHGVLGSLALTFGDGDTAARRDLLAGGGTLMLLLTIGALGFLGVVLAALILFPIAVVMTATGRVRARFVPPMAGGSIFVETFAVFLAGFLLLKLAGGLLVAAAPGEAWTTYAVLGAQWLLLPIVLWPRLRGMSAGAWRSAVGLHAGAGVGREIAAGVIGYLALLPLVMLAMLATAALLLMRSLQPGAEPPSNAIQEFLSRADLPLQLLLAFTAVFWAPIVEEIIFRGGVYRHLRSRLHPFIAAGVATILFGFMHGYDVMLLLPVMTLGFNFALLREWRGSLIAAMTAHALHNGTVMVVALVALNVMG